MLCGSCKTASHSDALARSSTKKQPADVALSETSVAFKYRTAVYFQHGVISDTSCFQEHNLEIQFMY